MLVEEFIDLLKEEFKMNADVVIAKQQKAYMKDKFAFFGLKAPVRRSLQKPFLNKKYLPPKNEMPSYVKSLLALPQREFHHVAQELAEKYVKQQKIEDIALYEYMICKNSWWDSVDYIATKLVAPYFLKFPAQQQVYVDKWLASGHLWLQRTAVIFQLQYKEKTDTQLLSYAINNLLGSKEFFINKAIGWALRNYSRTNARWVVDFVNATPNLHSLSRREALRLL